MKKLKRVLVAAAAAAVRSVAALVPVDQTREGEPPRPLALFQGATEMSLRQSGSWAVGAAKAAIDKEFA